MLPKVLHIPKDRISGIGLILKKKLIKKEKRSYFNPEVNEKVYTLKKDTIKEHDIEYKLGKDDRAIIRLYRGLNPPTMRTKGKYYFHDSNGHIYYQTNKKNDYRTIYLPGNK
jgi:maltose-binding protein MalE